MWFRARLVALVVCVLVGCAKAPPNLSPSGARAYQANQAVVALGTVQHAAIELNKIQVCNPAPCHPLFSNKDTAIVVDNVTTALTTMRTVPQGWKATALSALQAVKMRLADDGKASIAAYLDTAIAIVSALTGDTP